MTIGLQTLTALVVINLCLTSFFQRAHNSSSRLDLVKLISEIGVRGRSCSMGIL